MSVIKELFSGYSKRIRLENSLQLQRAKLTRPPQVKLEVCTILNGIDEELNDPKLRALFDSIAITVPEDL